MRSPGLLALPMGFPAATKSLLPAHGFSRSPSAAGINYDLCLSLRGVLAAKRRSSCLLLCSRSNEMRQRPFKSILVPVRAAVFGRDFRALYGPEPRSSLLAADTSSEGICLLGRRDDGR